MKWVKNSLIIFLFVATLTMLSLHAGVIHFFFSSIQEEVFSYLFWDYLCLCVFSTLFITTLIKVKKDYLDNFGYIILALMTLKTALSYVLFEYLFKESSNELETYKFNFLVLFIFYLGIDVYSSLKLLNDSE